MDKEVFRPKRVVEIIGKQSTKIAGAVASGGIAASPFVGGRADKAMAIVGGVAAAYVVVRVWRHFAGSPEEIIGEEPASETQDIQGSVRRRIS